MELIIDHSVDSLALALLANYVQKQAKTAIEVTVFSREQWDLLKQSPQFSYYLKLNPKGETPFLVNKTTKQVVIGPRDVQAAIIAAAPSANQLFTDKKEIDTFVTIASTELNATEQQKLLPALNKLNKMISTVVFAANNRISWADLVLFGALQSKIASWSESDRTHFVHLCRWFDNIQHLPQLEGWLHKVHLFVELKRNIGKQHGKEEKPAAKEEKPAAQQGEKKQQAKPEAKADDKKQAAQGKKQQQQPQEKKEKAKPAAKAVAKADDRPVDVSLLDLRVGHIIKCERVPNTEKLYISQINVGEEKPRSVVSGLALNIPIDEMQNRFVVVVCNLKPAKLGGVVSEGMVIAASNDDHSKVEILDPPAGAKAGERIKFEGYTGEPEAELNPKKKVLETVKPDLSTNAECIGVYKGTAQFMTTAGPCRVKSLSNCKLG